MWRNKEAAGFLTQPPPADLTGRHRSQFPLGFNFLQDALVQRGRSLRLWLQLTGRYLPPTGAQLGLWPAELFVNSSSFPPAAVRLVGAWSPEPPAETATPSSAVRFTPEIWWLLQPFPPDLVRCEKLQLQRGNFEPCERSTSCSTMLKNYDS